MGSRKQFENHSRFKGMDFTRSATHPMYYESPYANGAWDGWQAARGTEKTGVQCAASNGHNDCPNDALLGSRFCAEHQQ